MPSRAAAWRRSARSRGSGGTYRHDDMIRDDSGDMTHYTPAAVLGAVHQDQVRRQERETQQDVHISANQIFYLSQIFLSHGNSFENT